MAVLREHGLAETELATARCDAVRFKLLKIGVVVTVTFRKIWLRLSSACPFQTLFERVLAIRAKTNRHKNSHNSQIVC